MKKFIYKIYQNDGTYIGTLPVRLPTVPDRTQILPVNLPSITSEINNGQGSLTIETNQKFDDFGEGGIIDHNNIVKLYVWDSMNHTTPVLIYTGIILTYIPFISGGNEGVKIQCVGRSHELSTGYYTSGGNYDFNKNQKASAIFQDIITNFQAVYAASDIAYTGASVEDSTTVLNLDFSKKKWKEAIDEVLKIAPAGWWWSIEPDGTANFKSKPSFATHTFNLRKNCEKIEVNKSMESVINNVIVSSSAPATPHTASDATSISAYGDRRKYITDTQIQDNTTAQARADKEVADNKDIKRRTTITINSTYDIESIKVGETCKILNYDDSGSLLDSNMRIVRIQYNGMTAQLTLEDNFQDLNKNLKNFILNN